MTENTPPRQLPVCLPPVADELLSSWIGRHAAFYAVPPLVMLRHCLPEFRSLRAADLHLSGDQEIRLARMFATKPAAVRRMTFTNVALPSRRMIDARPLQCCTNCSSGHAGLAPILRSQFLGWRITCPLCGDVLQGVNDGPSPFRQCLGVARRGEKLLDDEAWRGSKGWASPAEIARLLLMRRVPLPPPPESEFWRLRVLGSIIPELDETLAAECTNFPTPQNPVLPLHLRPALLAGVAIVHRAGAEMLHMLRRHTHGLNRKRFDRHALPFMARPSRDRRFAQMQLI
jgi:hypothetical protein